jgi:hypothetical protein
MRRRCTQQRTVGCRAGAEVQVDKTAAVLWLSSASSATNHSRTRNSILLPRVWDVTHLPELGSGGEECPVATGS